MIAFALHATRTRIVGYSCHIHPFMRLQIPHTHTHIRTVNLPSHRVCQVAICIVIIRVIIVWSCYCSCSYRIKQQLRHIRAQMR